MVAAVGGRAVELESAKPVQNFTMNRRRRRKMSKNAGGTNSATRPCFHSRSLHCNIGLSRPYSIVSQGNC